MDDFQIAGFVFMGGSGDSAEPEEGEDEESAQNTHVQPFKSERRAELARDEIRKRKNTSGHVGPRKAQPIAGGACAPVSDT
jgi:hypothetical protein